MATDAQVTPVGLFNYANSYRQAAEALLDVRVNATHAEAPTEFLFFHAIELYLKSFLRAEGSTVRDLLKLGHDMSRIWSAYESSGGYVTHLAQEALMLMAETDAVIRARYIATGYFRKPSLQALSHAAVDLHQNVGEALLSRGLTVRIDHAK